jgi:hypothetical protein
MYAEADKALAQAQALEGGKRTVSTALDAYEHYLRFDKQNKESSIETTLYRSGPCSRASCAKYRSSHLPNGEPRRCIGRGSMPG